jgi:hypothetical protein
MRRTGPPSSCAEKMICHSENSSSQEHRRCCRPTFEAVRKQLGSGASCKAPRLVRAPSLGIRSSDTCRKHRRSSGQSSRRLATSLLESNSSEKDPSSNQPCMSIDRSYREFNGLRGSEAIRPGNHEVTLLAVVFSGASVGCDAGQCRAGFLATSETNIFRLARLRERITSCSALIQRR